MLVLVRPILAGLVLFCTHAVLFDRSVAALAGEDRVAASNAEEAETKPVLAEMEQSTPKELPTSAFSRALTNRFNPLPVEEASSGSFVQQVLWISLIAMCVVFLAKSGHRLVPIVARYVPSWDNASATAAGLSAGAAAEQQGLANFVIAFRESRPTDPSAVPGPGGKNGGDSQRASAGPSEPPAFSFASGESEIQSMARTFCRVSTTSDVASQQQALRALSGLVTSFKDRTTAPELTPLWQIAAALEGLLKHMTTKAADVTASTLKTTSQAIELLRELCAPGLKPELAASPSVRILVVDDDPITRTTISMALKKFYDSPDVADSGEQGLEMASKNHYDVILLDVEMGGIDGFEACSKIHQTEANGKTPVIFVTSHSNYNSRAKASMAGGQCLIAKPFLAFELILKTLTQVLDGRMGSKDEAAATLRPQRDAASTAPTSAPSRTAPQVAEPAPAAAERPAATPPVTENPKPEAPLIEESSKAKRPAPLESSKLKPAEESAKPKAPLAAESAKAKTPEPSESPKPQSLPPAESPRATPAVPVELLVPVLASAQISAPSAPVSAPAPLQLERASARSNSRSGKLQPEHAKFLTQGAVEFAEWRNRIAAGNWSSATAEIQDTVGELYVAVAGFKKDIEPAQLEAISRLLFTLEGLLKKVIDRPAVWTPSRWNTIAAAIDLLEELCREKLNPPVSETVPQVLVVDDDPIARRATAGALQLAFGRPDNADSGEAALTVAGQKAFDLIFMDILMPGMDGFKACEKIHQTGLNQNTPVIFVTSRTDADLRDQVEAAGGCGFIPKPVLAGEIMLTALTFVIRGRLGHPGSAAKPATAAEPRVAELAVH